ncbi:signal transduction histidine kinase [Vibrio ichthyoenteri ATCC 700023]|uniref:histidine kinase n=1 Tax=Vibrio ichthyoenteri ATCC 700023 TaxID=870968 RepID=F9S495_9VIBR|nr:transporter substrate-binding domain-containing protein [Vibrio ichthyoenteri]EGU37076.1 signal transduction histidine kinase [Vibrio ichthyoenteri ATCC 700023]
MPEEKWAPYWGGIDNPSGLYHDFLLTLTEALGLELTYRGYDDFEKLFAAIENHDVDVTLGFASSQSRNQRFNFSAPLISLKKIIWLADETLQYKDPASWTWVCVRGGEDCEALEKFGVSKFVTSNKLNVVAQMLRHNMADATITTLMEVNQYILDPRHSKGRIFLQHDMGKAEIGLMMAKDRPQIKQIFNSVIAEHKLPLANIKLSNLYVLNEMAHWQLLQNQQKNATIRYTITEQSYPLSYVDDKTGEVRGYVHDLLRLLERKTLFEFEYVPANGRNIEEMLEQGLVDVLPGRNVYSIDHDKQLITESYAAIEYGLIKAKNSNSKRVLAVLDRTDTLHQQIRDIQQHEPVVVYSNAADMLVDFNKGKITHLLLDREIIEDYLYSPTTSQFDSLPKPDYMDFEIPLVMSVRQDSALLLNMLSRMLAITDHDEIAALRESHSKLFVNYGYSKNVVNSYVIWALLLVTVFVLVGITILWMLSGRLKRTQKINQLSQSEISWLSTLLDSMPSIIFITDEDEKIVFTNSAYHGHVKSCEKHIDASTKKRCDFITDVMATETNEVLHYPQCDCWLSGHYFHIRHQAIIHPELGSNHRMTIIDDITTEKQFEADLQLSNEKAMQAIEARSHFLAVVSHELRTPIAAMMGLMELLQFNLKNQQDAELLKNAIHSAQRLKRQVNEILDFSKIEARQLQIDIRRHNVYQELCPSLRSFETAAKVKGLEFILDWHPSKIHQVDFDAMRVNQVLANLLSNALKFTKTGQITVTIVHSTESMTITVADTGCGMTPQHLTTVFEPFVQADKGISRRFGGTGLGMSITKNLIELMDGNIDIHSDYGVGTSVICTIPTQYHTQRIVLANDALANNTLEAKWLSVWQEKEALPLNAKPPIENVYPDKLFELWVANSHDEVKAAKTINDTYGVVLVADDDVINQMLLHKQLTRLGVNAHIVSNGQEALDYLQQHTEYVSLVLTDCHMPIMNGFELTEIIRSKPDSFGQLSVIGCTAEDSRMVTEKAQACGMNEVLYKPYTLDELRRTLIQYLSVGNSNAQNRDVAHNEKSNINWLLTGSEQENMEMALVVVDSFKKEILALKSGTKDDKSIIHRIKGSSALLNMEELTALAKAFETTEVENDKSALKQRIIFELNAIIDNVTQWLETRQ